MSDKRTTLIYLLRDQVSGTAKNINKELDKIGTKAKGAGTKISGLTGGLTSLINPSTIAIGILGGVALGLKDIFDGALAYEKVSGRLDTALANNITGYDGNRTAIDLYLAKALDFGFTNDELADSLADLVTATDNVTDAEGFQGAAMDLARAKGIPLKDATDDLTLAFDGNLEPLRKLGVVLPEHATKAQILAGVLALAGGAATTYSDTTSGAMDKVKSKMDALGDKIGEKLMPALEALATFFLTVIIPAIELVVDTVTTLITKVQEAIDWIHSLTREADEKFIKPGSKLDQFFKANPAPVPFLGPHNAAGGFAPFGQLAMFGERGPELGIPGVGGYDILTASQTRDVMSGGRGPSVVHTHVYLDRYEIAKAVSEVQYYDGSRASPSAVRK